MRQACKIGFSAALWCITISAYGQRLAPIADPVDTHILPGGISGLSVDLNAKLAYVFSDEDGTQALHLIGDFVLTLGKGESQTFTSREAVVWLVPRMHEGRPFRHLQILLWRDAEIHEIGGTLTTGPALFVTLSTFGTINANVDDVAFQSSAESRIYREGNPIRKALGEGSLRATGEGLSFRVLDASGFVKRDRALVPRPVLRVRSEGDWTTVDLADARQVLTVTGGLYLARGVPGSSEFLEIQADSVVIFLPPSGGMPAATGRAATGIGGPGPPEPQPAADARGASDRQLMATGFGDVEVEGAYLEGDVVMTQGPNMIRASRLYYDFQRERAVLLDAVVRTSLVQRNIPLYVRAAEIRQLSRRHFTANDAILTTSEFYTPHYHVGAGRVELVDRTPPDPTGQQTGMRAGSFRVRHATLNLGGTPVAYLPFIQGNIDTSETAIKSVRAGYSDDFGLELETEWHLFNVLDLETPDGFDATLSLDYFTNRGPAAGVDAKYDRDEYFGLLRSYLLVDSDEDFLGRERETDSEQGTRGRFLLRHRQYLEDDWQLSLELSYISDRGFLEEFFESEWDNEKEQETLLYLKRQRENRALTVTAQARVLDFATQTERLPEVGLHVAGEPLAFPTAGTTWFGESRLGYVRLRPADQTFLEFLRQGRPVGSGSVARVDTRHELDVPVDLGPIRLVPFAMVRGTSWDDSPEGGGTARAFGTYGVRGSMYLTRTYPDVRSPLFDIDGLRHIIKPNIVAWISHTNRDSHELFQFDELVEGIDEVDGVSFGVRQRWQTRRSQGATRRTVDVVTLDVDVGVFNDAGGNAITNGYAPFSRPEESISRNYVNSSFIWRMNDRTALLSELNYDMNDGEVDIMNVSLVVERSPRFSYLLGYRSIEETDSELLGFDMNYRLTEKHTLAVRELADLSRGRTLDFTIAFIRKFPRWFGAVSFALDEAEDDFGVSVSFWPEGLPQATLGSRRFTGLASTTRLRGD